MSYTMARSSTVAVSERPRDASCQELASTVQYLERMQSLLLVTSVYK